MFYGEAHGEVVLIGYHNSSLLKKKSNLISKVRQGYKAMNMRHKIPLSRRAREDVSCRRMFAHQCSVTQEKLMRL